MNENPITPALLATLMLGAAWISVPATFAADGRELIGTLNCAACHAPTEKQTAWLSPKTAPRLAEVGSRASAEWLQRHLFAPHETMPGTTMPDVLHGLGEKDRAPAAEALTHYLISLEPSKFRRVLPGRAAVALGEGLYHRIGCVACHAPQNAPTNVMSSAPLPRSADCDDFSATRWRRVPQAGCRE